MPPATTQFGITGLDRLGSEHHRLEAGAADLVYSKSADRDRNTCEDRCLPSRILTEASRDNVAHHDLLDL